MNKAMIEAVRAYAKKHYLLYGWNYVVETMSDKDIAKWTNGCATNDEAIAAIAGIVSIWNDVRADVMESGK